MIYKLDTNEISKAVVAYLTKKKVEGADSPYYSVTLTHDADSFWAEVAFTEVRIGQDLG